MSHLEGHPLSGYPVNGKHARSQELVLGASVVPRVVVVEKLDGFDAVAIVKLFAGLKPLGVVGKAGAVGHRGSEIGCAYVDGKCGASGELGGHIRTLNQRVLANDVDG